MFFIESKFIFMNLLLVFNSQVATIKVTTWPVFNPYIYALFNMNSYPDIVQILFLIYLDMKITLKFTTKTLKHLI